MKTQIINGVENESLFKCLYYNNIDIKKPYIIKEKSADDMLLTINNLKKQGHGRTIIFYSIYDNWQGKNRVIGAGFDNLSFSQGLKAKLEKNYYNIDNRYRVGDIKSDFVSINKTGGKYYIVNQAENFLRKPQKKEINQAERIINENDKKDFWKRANVFYPSIDKESFDKSGYWLNHYRGDLLIKRLEAYKERKTANTLPLYLENWRKNTLPTLQAVFENVLKNCADALKLCQTESIDFIDGYSWRIKQIKENFKKLQDGTIIPNEAVGHWGQKLSSRGLVGVLEEFEKEVYKLQNKAKESLIDFKL